MVGSYDLSIGAYEISGTITNDGSPCPTECCQDQLRQFTIGGGFIGTDSQEFWNEFTFDDA